MGIRLTKPTPGCMHKNGGGQPHPLSAGDLALCGALGKGEVPLELTSRISHGASTDSPEEVALILFTRVAHPRSHGEDETSPGKAGNLSRVCSILISPPRHGIWSSW